MNFNQNRFANFAKYDLAINKTFYRSLAFVTLAGAVSIALLCFISRYSLYNTMVSDHPYMTIDPNSFEGFNWIHGTAIYEWAFLIFMMTIFPGCWAHNLRNKQGRINELTLPATNLEKFIWHALLVFVGGLAVCFLSLLAADGINALLTIIAYGTENGVASLTWNVLQNISARFLVEDVITGPFSALGTYSATGIEEGNPVIDCYNAITYFVITSSILQPCIYFFGNALKYRYNIIFTYIFLQVLGTIIVFFFVFGVAMVGDSYETSEDVVHDMTVLMCVIGTINLILSALLLWLSYNRYTKAQITSPLNK